MRVRSPNELESAAALIHAGWRERLKLDGVSSRPSHWGEELMVPWERLSERAKEWNRNGIRDVDAVDELLDQRND